MASQAFRSMSNSVLFTYNGSAAPWTPSSAGEVGVGNAPMRSLECFLFPTQDNVNSEPISFRSVFGNARAWRLRYNTLNQIEVEFRDSSMGTGASSSTDIEFILSAPGISTTGLNQWWHFIFDSTDTNWRMRLGRVGVGPGGQQLTADPIEAYFTALGPAHGGIRNTVGLRLTNGHPQTACIGQRLNASPTPGQFVSGTDWHGHIAELRIWADVLPDKGPISYTSLRNQFVTAFIEAGAVAVPNLLHCFRLNEPAGTPAASFDDVGFKNAYFQTDAGATGGFTGPGGVGTGTMANEHPFFVQQGGGQVDLAPSTTNAAGTAAAPAILRSFAMTPGTSRGGGTAVAPSLRITHALTPSTTTAGATAASPAIQRSFGLTPAAATAAGTAASPGVTLDAVLTPASATGAGTAASPTLNLDMGLAPAAADGAGVIRSPADLFVTDAPGEEVTLEPVPATAGATANAPSLGMTRALVPVAANAAGTANAPAIQRSFALSPGSAAGAGSAGAPGLAVSLRLTPGSAAGAGTATASFASTSTLSADVFERETIDAELITMEAYMSVLDIWNAALTRLAIDTVTSAPTSDGSPQGVDLAANWPLFKEKFLRDHGWDGAKKTAVLATFKHTDGTTAVTPAGTRWSNAFQLPTDHVRSLRLNGEENMPGAKSLGGGHRGAIGLWEEEVVTNDAGTRKRCLLTDDATAELEYVFLVPDNEITLIPADTRWAMALKLAVHMASKFGKTEAEKASLANDAEQALRDARRTDAQTGARPTVIDSTLADSFY